MLLEYVYQNDSVTAVTAMGLNFYTVGSANGATVGIV